MQVVCICQPPEDHPPIPKLTSCILRILSFDVIMHQNQKFVRLLGRALFVIGFAFSPVESWGAHAFNSQDGSNYETNPLLGEDIRGASAPNGSNTGYRSIACRFVSGASGLLELINIPLGGNTSNGAVASVKVVMYEDRGGKIGAPFKQFEITDMTSSPFIQNRHIRWNLDRSTYFVKGRAYWIAVEPLTANSRAMWPRGKNANALGRKLEIGSEGFKYSKGNVMANAGIIGVRTPPVPAVTSPTNVIREGNDLPGAPEGTTLLSLGNTAQIPLRAVVRVDNKRQPAILGDTGTVQLVAGGSAPGLANGVIATLGEPAGNAVLAGLKKAGATEDAPAVSSSNNSVLIGGLRADSPEILVRKGDSPEGAGGATVRSFSFIDGDGATTFFFASLTGEGTKASNRLALCATLPGGASKVLVRRGQEVEGKIVTAITSLTGVRGTTAEGRWRIDADTIGVRLSFGRQGQAIYSIPVSAETPADWTRWAATGDVLLADPDEPELADLGFPGFGPDGVAFQATLKRGVAGVSSANNVVLVRMTHTGTTVLARKGQAVRDGEGNPIEGQTYFSFGHPVTGSGGKVAFTGKLRGAPSTDAMWWSDGGDSVKMFARRGDNAPFGGRFASFKSLVLPNGNTSTPVFEARLSPEPAIGVNSSSNEGVWGLNPSGAPVMIAKKGATLNINANLRGPIRSLVSLSAAAGSTGIQRGANDSRQTWILATITNTTESKPTKRRLLVRANTPAN